MLTNTLYKHIVLTDDGVPMIEGTTMKVIELALNHTAYGWEPEELLANHPYLTLGQIYSVLAYYWDHREELDREIARRLERVEQLQDQTQSSKMRHKLQSAGMIE